MGLTLSDVVRCRCKPVTSSAVGEACMLAMRISHALAWIPLPPPRGMQTSSSRRHLNASYCITRPGGLNCSCCFAAEDFLYTCMPLIRTRSRDSSSDHISAYHIVNSCLTMVCITFKGSVQRKLRWVKNSISCWLLAWDRVAGHFCFNWRFWTNRRSAAKLFPCFTYSFVSLWWRILLMLRCFLNLHVRGIK